MLANRKMAYYGAHLSIAKGLPAVLDEAERLQMTAIQIFARNPRGRGESKVDPNDAAEFRQQLKRRDWKLVIHAPYYVNLGSGSNNNQRIAREVTKLDLEKGDLLGADYVVVHLGTPGDGFSLDDGVQHTIANVEAILQHTDTHCQLLLETSAGSKKVGSTFEQLAEILRAVNQPKRLGVCLDTCHLFVSGYDIRASKMREVIDSFDQVIGLKQLRVIHCNDTQSEIGGGWDRHWHLGQGQIGDAAFHSLLQDARLADKVFILETPKEQPDGGGKDADRLNMASLRRLAGIQ